jgi:hypothetical protein
MLAADQNEAAEGGDMRLLPADVGCRSKYEAAEGRDEANVGCRSKYEAPEGRDEAAAS